MAKVMTAAALCAVGAEKALSNELRKLGFTIDEGGFGRVRFKADLAGLYRALMGLRTADRLLLETAWFSAVDFDALFEGTRQVPWENYVPRGAGLVVSKVRSNRSVLRAETSIQAIVHKAAAGRLCEKWGLRRLPDDGEKAELRVYVEKDRVSLLLDLSGDPLFKRGYRLEGGPAPLRETTAAALILLSGWKRKFPLYDPFCGSGTIAAEAALYAFDIAPGLFRGFALERLLVSDRGTEKAARDELLSRIDFSRQVRIFGSDADGKSVSLAENNINRIVSSLRGKVKNTPAPVSGLPRFKALAMEKAEAPQGMEEGFLVTNPPYGKRLGDRENAETLYTEMSGLARRFPGWKLVVITDHPGFESFFGVKADSCREITNGAMESYLYQYEKL